MNKKSQISLCLVHLLYLPLILNCSQFYVDKRKSLTAENKYEKYGLVIELHNLDLTTASKEIGEFRIKLSAEFDSSIKDFHVKELKFKAIELEYEKVIKDIKGELKNNKWNSTLDNVYLPYESMNIFYRYNICPLGKCREKQDSIKIKYDEDSKIKNFAWEAIMGI